MLVQLPTGDWVNPAYVSEVEVDSEYSCRVNDEYYGPFRVRVRLGGDCGRFHVWVVKGTREDAENVRDDWAETLNAAATGEQS